ncbi:hypothetical protein JCM10908_005213 [Rhodotorula pacifica]|uniref:uncharacterized protein n=1 Tax=Rhodotorula pacifica TaxID=1495444 RepID=UPI0031718226
MSTPASNARSPPPAGGLGGPRKRVRGAVDTSLILEGERSRKRTSNAVDLGSGSRAPGAPHPNTLPAHDAEGYERVRQLGVELYDRLIAETDRNEPSRPLYLAFAELPNPHEYPDYYKMLKKPISFKEVKERLDTLQYRSFPDAKTDMNQIFVNAKRYNAPGSPIFNDAKRLHKVLKDTYATMTGEAEPPRDEEDAPEPVAVVESRAPTEDSRGDDIKRAIQLKPWLLKKLNETTALHGPDGRRLADQFEKLPDRNLWPDYYQIISSPQSFSTVKYRTTHRYYATAASFIEDVNLIFDNALYYNEESSGIAQDAIAMKRHFVEVMREQPPHYVPPREPKKYKKDPEAKAKQKRQVSVVPVTAEPEANVEQDPYGDGDEESDDDMSRHGSVAPDGLHAYDGGAQHGGATQQQQQHQADPFALPNSYGSAPADLPVYDASNGLNGLATASAAVSYGHQQPDASAGMYAPIAGMLKGSPATQNGGVAPRPDMYMATSSNTPRAPRHIARLPAPGEAPLVSHLEVTLSSSSSSSTAPSKPIVLENANIRQHSLSIPYSTDRVEIALRFAAGGHDLKGKAKAENGFAEAGLTSSDDPLPQVTSVVRPAALALEEIAELPAATVPPSAATNGLDLAVNGGSGINSAVKGAVKRYSLVPRSGLSVVEFLVRPVGATGTEGEEVFRLFITK